MVDKYLNLLYNYLGKEMSTFYTYYSWRLVGIRDGLITHLNQDRHLGVAINTFGELVNGYYTSSSRRSNGFKPRIFRFIILGLYANW